MSTTIPVVKEALVLSDEKIHVFLYQLSLYNSKDLILYLSDDEKNRADKLKIQEKKDQFIITRSLLRRLLSSNLGKEPQNIIISYLEHGKPIINDKINNKAIEFNVSHSGDYTLIALTLENKIGVDIEEINSNVDHLSLANRFFSDEEKTQILSLDEGQQCDAFYRIWARKESFIKATGEGIAFGLDRFSVPLGEISNEGMEVVTSVAMDRDWFCYNLMNIDNYKTALTTTKKNNAIVICH